MSQQTVPGMVDLAEFTAAVKAELAKEKRRHVRAELNFVASLAALEDDFYRDRGPSERVA